MLVRGEIQLKVSVRTDRFNYLVANSLAAIGIPFATAVDAVLSQAFGSALADPNDRSEIETDHRDRTVHRYEKKPLDTHVSAIKVFSTRLCHHRTVFFFLVQSELYHRDTRSLDSRSIALNRLRVALTGNETDMGASSVNAEISRQLRPFGGRDPPYVAARPHRAGFSCVPTLTARLPGSIPRNYMRSLKHPSYGIWLWGPCPGVPFLTELLFHLREKVGQSAEEIAKDGDEPPKRLSLN